MTKNICSAGHFQASFEDLLLHVIGY